MRNNVGTVVKYCVSTLRLRRGKAFMTLRYGPNAYIAILVLLAALTRRFSLKIDVVNRADAIDLVESVLRLIANLAIARTSERYPNTYLANDRMTNKPIKKNEPCSIREVLGNAWTVYRGDRDYHIEVLFHPPAAEQVAETQWHHIPCAYGAVPWSRGEAGARMKPHGGPTAAADISL